MIGRVLLVLGAVWVLCACPGENRPSVEVLGREVEGIEKRSGDVAVCLQAEPFVAEGVVALESAGAGDAREVRNIRYGIREGCERVVIDLSVDGRAARSAGDVRAEVLGEAGVVRVELRDVESVAPGATERHLGGGLASSVVSMRSPEQGWVLVEIHLRREAEAAVSTFDDPARVVIDLRAGG